MNDQEREITRICNRHMARLLTNLEDADCRPVHIGIVRAEMQWLRSDLLRASENGFARPIDPADRT
jgi:hypothetical protein